MLHQKILDSVVPIFAFFDSPSSSETSRMCRELSITRNDFLDATREPFSFAYVDKINKSIKKNFNENI